MLDVKALLTKILQKLASISTVTTPTISITASTGTLQGHTIRKYGNIVQLHIQVKKTSATSSGSNVFQGTISTAALRPRMITTSATYLGAYSLPATIGTDGLITVRNATASSLAAMTSNANVSFTYIVQ